MTEINANFRKLPGGYLFPEIARRVRAYSAQNPRARLIRLGIGDVTLPLAPCVTAAMEEACREMGRKETFRGYCEETNGSYGFLRRAIQGAYRDAGVELADDEIFVSDGAKSDCANIGELFPPQAVAAVCDPVYPVYVDSSAIAGRAGTYDPATGRWDRLVYLPCTAENGFFPTPPAEQADLIYLCSPNNPTGTAADRAQLRRWVDYANARGSVLLFDGAYEAFITRPEIPHSIFEIPGARTCAIEFRSFSKSAGFTGVRCAYTVIPRELNRGGMSLNALWARRQSTKFNGVAYVVQRAAQAALSPQGLRETGAAIQYYRRNAQTLRDGLTKAGLTVCGGVDAPYLWVKTPDGMDSWGFFDHLLRRAGVVSTPGAGFGPGGEGYIRLTAFGEAEQAREAVERIRTALA